MKCLGRGTQKCWPQSRIWTAKGFPVGRRGLPVSSDKAKIKSLWTPEFWTFFNVDPGTKSLSTPLPLCYSVYLLSLMNYIIIMNLVIGWQSPWRTLQNGGYKLKSASNVSLTYQPHPFSCRGLIHLTQPHYTRREVASMAAVRTISALDNNG